MIRYFGKQYFLRALVILIAIFVVIPIRSSVAYLISKPDNTRLHITEYSSILFDQVNCQSINTDTAIWSFPIVLYYQTPDPYTSFQAKDGNYSAQLDLWNVEAMYLTTSRGSIEIQNSEQTQINIQAKTFTWDSNVSPKDFSPVEHLEFDRLYGNLDDNDGSYFGNTFAWIKPDPWRFTMGLCGDGLIYFPGEKGAGFTNPNSIALLTSPAEMDQSTDSPSKVALIFRFGNVVSFSVDNKNYSADEEILLHVIQKNHSTMSGFRLVATGLSDPDIESCYSFTKLKPGFVCPDSGRGTTDASDELLKIGGNAQALTIIEPIGYGMQRFAKTDLPEKTTQLTVSAQVGDVDISQESPSIPLVITGDRLSAKANDVEQFQSPWEKLPSELKAVWFSIYASFFISLLSVGFQLSSTLKQFWKWFTSKPVYRPLVVLRNGVYIFQLINGKKISGIIDTYEGRSTFRIFVLTEVREWDKDNWGEVLPTEVRVPQNQIEMYYKAHP